MKNDMGKVVPFRRKNENTNNLNMNNNGDVNKSLSSAGNANSNLYNVQNDYAKMTIEQANWLKKITDNIIAIENKIYVMLPTNEFIDIAMIDFDNNIIYQNDEVLNMYPWGTYTIKILTYVYGKANYLLNEYNHNRQLCLSNQLNILKTQTEANKLKSDADKYITILSSDCTLESIDKIYENKVDSLNVIDKYEN